MSDNEIYELEQAINEMIILLNRIKIIMNNT